MRSTANQSPLALAKLDDDISSLELLISDLKALRKNGAPSEQALQEAPVLTEWTFAARPARCLMGQSTGHPLLPGNERPIVTSEVWFVDHHNDWVRTLNRFYRLGKPRSGGAAQ